MEVVNPYSKGTWFNHAAPRLPQWMHDELVKIGGYVPSGEYMGRPILAFAWGQEAMAFRCGRMRLKYVDGRIPAQETRRHYLWRTTSELDHLDRETGLPVFKIERRDLVDTNPPAIIPAGWFYQEEIPELTWIGQQLWYIEQWKPAEMLGSEEMWKANRYDLWEDPETGKEAMTDMVGPFPGGGRYEPVFMVAEHRRALLMKPDSFLEDKHALVEKDVMCYTEPTKEHIESVRKAWRERDERPFETMLELSRKAFAREKERREAAKTVTGKENAAKVREAEEDLKPKVFQREVNLTNMPTRFGKGRRINVS